MKLQRILTIGVVLACFLSLAMGAGTINPHTGELLSPEAQEAWNEECVEETCDGEEQEEVFEEDAETPVTYYLTPYGVGVAWTDRY